MNNIIRFRARIEPKLVGTLLEQASDSHVFLHRLLAEARLTYGTKSDTFNYVREMLATIEKYIQSSTKYLEWVEDQQAELSITGNLPIEMLRERRQRLDERIKAYERLHPRLVVAELRQG